MALDRLTAQFLCDECGEVFRVDLDPATETNPPAFSSLYDYAEDAIRGGLRTGEGRDGRMGIVSVQEGKHLCSLCTKQHDEEE